MLDDHVLLWVAETDVTAEPVMAPPEMAPVPATTVPLFVVMGPVNRVDVTVPVDVIAPEVTVPVPTFKLPPEIAPVPATTVPLFVVIGPVNWAAVTVPVPAFILVFMTRGNETDVGMVKLEMVALLL